MNEIYLTEILHPTIEMNEPNEPIVIHEGDFELVRKLGISV